MTNTIPWGKQGAAFEPGGPIPMLTCRPINPQSPRETLENQANLRENRALIAD